MHKSALSETTLFSACEGIPNLPVAHQSHSVFQIFGFLIGFCFLGVEKQNTHFSNARLIALAVSRRTTGHELHTQSKDVMDM